MNILKKTIGVLLPSMRISFALVLLTACLLLSAEMLGFTPDESKLLLNARKHVTEALAIQFSLFAPDKDAKKIQKLLAYVVKRNPEILSAGIRLQHGQLIFQVGNHTQQWDDYLKKESDSTHLIVPILQNSQPWGNIEIKFVPLRGESGSGFFGQPIFKMGIFVLIIGFFVFLVFMLRTLRMLDPSAVIPDRVNAAFDTLAEGVIILDEYQQIVLANKAFTEKMSRPMSSLLGVNVSKLKWQSTSADFSGHDFPWRKVLKTGKSVMGTQLSLASSQGNVFSFLINASPIQGGDAGTQGVLITLDDITGLEERNTALQVMVSRLEDSQSLIQQQNKELHYLSTRDPLTGCLNRRSFAEQFEKAFKEARQNNSELSCIMADIDHFKKVNDTYGHATGDEVIKLLAEILHANTRNVDLVSRYGGEEFCVVLPGLSVDEAVAVAERIRLRLKDESANRYPTGPRVMASLGVSSNKDNPATSGELNHFADQALYVAKTSGRNRVIRWQPDAESGVHTEPKLSPVEENKQNIKIETDSLATLQLRVNELEHIASQFSVEIEYSKNYDALTGLPNQILFYDRISQVIGRGYRHDQLAAVLVVDMGMFSQVNTSLGRSAGDRLLIEIAGRLNATFRKSDDITRLTVSRFGGDEFAVLLTELPSKEAVTWMVKRLLDSLAVPVDIDGNSIFLASHVGISLYPSDASSVDDLINNAMIAKKYCKQLYKETNYQFFDHSMQELSLKYLNLDKELRLAIQNEEWELHYQPKMDIKTKSIIGVEALIRWKHPVRGLLSPFEFIDFAEQRGLIVDIGDWVIKTACNQLKEWAKLGLVDYKIAVNLSAVQLRQDDFVDKVFHALATAGVPPRLLELEVTETTLMNNFQVALASLQRLHSRGITIAIDDFGTGYSSLSYLKNLPINTLKIDRAFIKDICNDENDKQIVKALINMAHFMNMLVVAEGVEEQDQFDLLAEYSCDEIQGYLLSKPVPANELTRMLIKPNRLMESLKILSHAGGG
jgi:diguanylate cyclase (GGDEF)-like protein/PAS domain S-box-containing protein